MDPAEIHRLLGQLRGDPAVPEALFRLLEAIVARLDGPWDPHEVPTRPLRKTPFPGTVKAPTAFRGTPGPFVKATAILDEAMPLARDPLERKER